MAIDKTAPRPVFAMYVRRWGDNAFLTALMQEGVEVAKAERSWSPIGLTVAKSANFVKRVLTFPKATLSPRQPTHWQAWPIVLTSPSVSGNDHKVFVFTTGGEDSR